MESQVSQLLKEKRRAISKGKWLDISRICNELGTYYASVGQFDEACDEHKEELEAAQQLGDAEGIALAHRLLGENLVQIGKHKDALHHHNAYLNLSVSELNSKIEEQRAWATLGRTYYTAFTAVESDLDLTKEKLLKKAENAYYRAGDLADSLHSYEQLTAKEHAEMKARISLNLGLIFEKRGEFNKCYECMKSAIFLCNKFGLKEDLHRCQFSLAGIYQNGDLIEEALEQINEACKSADSLKSDLLLYDCYTVKARLLISLNNYSDAKLIARKAYKISPEGKKDEARDFYQTVKGLKELYDNVENIKNLEKLADGLAYIGLYKKAIENYRDIIDSCQTENINIASIYYSIAETYLDDNQNELAIEFFNKEIELNKSSPKEQIKTLLRIANVYENMGKQTQALKTYEQAKKISQNHQNDETLQIQVLKELKYFMKENHHSDLDSVTEELNQLLENSNLPDSEDQVDTEVKTGPFSYVNISDSSDDESTRTTATSRTKRSGYVVRKNEKGETPLHRACISGNLKQVENLIEKGHPLNVRDNCGWLPIHEACNHGFAEITEVLIQNGAWINDPGGEGCGGVTPLHDASVGGHFDVIEILLRHRALVTVKDKDGQNVLDVLYQWKDNNDDATLEELTKFNQIESLIRERMIESGINPSLKRKRDREVKSSGWVSDESDSNAPMVLDDEELALINQNDDECVINPFFDNDLQTNLDNPNVARREYRSAICNVRKRTKTDTSVDKSFQPMVLDDDELALISPNDDECVVNPFLEKDLTTDLDDPNEARREYQSAISNVRKRTKTDTSVDKSFEPIGALVDEDKLITEDDDWLIQDTRTSNANKPAKRKRQTKLNFSVERQSRESKLSRNHRYRNDSPINLDNFTIAESLSPKPPINSVKIKIKDKVIIIPIQDFDKTFQWLAEEASERYNTQTGMKPILILQRLDDKAVYSPNDKIGSMLENGSVIEGAIQTWNQPELGERYVTNCPEFKCKPSKKLYDKLKSSEETKIISLENINLEIQIGPVLKAISYQFSLRSLLLSMIDLSNERNLNLICQTLATLPNLIQLKLDCCGLNADFFNQLNETVDEDLNIQELSLDYNNFEKLTDNLSSAVKIFKRIKNLEKLSLKYCYLKSVFLKSREIQNVLLNSRKLRILNVSGNILGLDGIKEYLNLLTDDKLINLDLSDTVNEAGIGQILNNHFFQANHTIKTLSLKSCFINDQDLKLLSKCVCNLTQVNEIDLSNNPAVTLNAISNFIKESKDSHVPIVTLNLEGTVILCHDNLEWFSNLLQLKLLRNVYVTVKPQQDVENSIRKCWEKIWGEKAVFRRKFCTLQLISL